MNGILTGIPFGYDENKSVNCLSCKHLVMIWGSFVCWKDNHIIPNPETYGRFCKFKGGNDESKQNISRKERQKK